MNSPAAINHKRKGFSLVELLVSLLIISTLGTLLLAGFRNVADKIDIAKCMNNLCGLERGAEAWSADHDNRIFPNLSMNPYAGWQSLLLGNPGIVYVENYHSFCCPSYARANHYDPNWTVYGSYGRSYFLSGSDGVPDFGGRHFDNNARLSKITNAARTVSFYEYNYKVSGDVYGGAPADGGTGWYVQLINAHDNGFNLVFFDGHAEYVKFNTSGKWQGYYPGDYPQFIWKPY